MPESTPINWYYIGLGFIVTMLGQVGAWYQHNMQFKYPNLNEWWWGWYVLAIPLTYLFMTATKYNVLGYGGSIWGARFVGFAIGMGAYAISQGKNVVHYTLELNEAYVGLRYDSIFSGVEGQNLMYHKDEVLEKVEQVKGELTIKYYPTRSCTVNTLSAHIKKATSFGAEVDMILVDYADIMRDIGKSTEMRHQLGNIYEDLRGLAGEMQIPIWTASQANRSALDEDVIDASKVAESYAKVMTADFVISVSRKIEDKIANTGRFHVIKNRFGPDGLTYPAKINTNIGKIELFESTSTQGKEVQSKIRSRDNQTKQMLSARYEDLMSD